MRIRSWLALTALVLIWGLYYLITDQALRSGWGDEMFGAARFCLGAVALCAWLLARRQGRRLLAVQRQAPLRLMLVAACMTAGVVLINVGQREVDSGLAGLLNATTPLFAGALALVGYFGRQRLRRRGWLGLMLGLFGVAVLYLPLVDSSSSVWSATLILSSSVCFALEAHLIARWFAAHNPLVLTALITAWAAAESFLWALAAGDFSTGSLWTLVALGLMSNALAYTVYLWLIQDSGPTFANLYAYLVPIVALLAGWLLNGESLTAYIAVGAAACIGGSLMVGRERASAVDH